MKNVTAASAALALMSTTALAGGLDRSGQPIGIIFEEGTYAEFGFAISNPDVSGTDLLGNETGNVANNFSSISGGYKTDLNDKMSVSLIFDQPFGVDVEYPGGTGITPTPGDDPLLQGTMARADSNSITALLRYKFDNNVSVHGGIRYQEVDGEVTLSGDAYNTMQPASGYNVKVNKDGALGWVAGAAYEKPEIALRVALTYSSEIEHDFALNETFPAILAPFLPGGTNEFPTSTKTKTPQSVNLDFQSGIAKDTLVFGGVRWAQHSKTNLIPPAFGRDLIGLDDTYTYTLGVGRRFNENWSGSLAVIYEDEGEDDLVSPLAPTNGMKAIRLGVQYKTDKIKVQGGLRYTKVGDAIAAPGDTAAANMRDNDVLSLGFKVGYYF
ncbi:Outer membrane protein transport protein (OMPP1/FadL/TodX) [Tritonibacter multivorans]|uniref:Outer membrane protein transport protein (OMPP1/FadL/TodX) n=1 Tax=Tritonibacter multivorans TaxID=928856 RepID=A0A0P1GY40_9RHOB|nr:outer membrane protein transport protein [Tritonibacter multivorans]MDA7421559.1 outer membrane protein transport protein [Tritonibacter multivorans]CUH82175.1 Outer membrane protein transport protein (OMPP1/FadL/TodX) [Tritonibacter multivorans]SFC95637.1 Long-chain fatty acid transport protein [Tritonibacter multivorans]